jgi:O-antigen/teichoic acid export membrane protein
MNPSSETEPLRHSSTHGKVGRFAKDSALTFATRLIGFVIALGTSVLLARALGPEGRGIYALAVLLPSLIVTFGNLGIGAATTYYVARKEFRRQQILGNNLLIGLGVSVVGVIAGLVVIVFFREAVFSGVPVRYLLLALILVPMEITFSFVRYVLLGAQRIKEFNYVQLAHSALFLAFIVLALVALKAGVTGAIAAGLLSWLVVDALVFVQAKKVAGGVDFALSRQYVRQVVTYGVQIQLANILGFLNYRLDMFLISGFLGPAAVGLYAVGVGMVEKLWTVSHAASTVLYPRVAAESDEQRKKDFTPLVARTVLWGTALGAVVLMLVSRWIVVLLYSEAFLPAAKALQALLVGVVALSAGRVLSNDIVGRGFPRLSIYGGVVALITNVALNVAWIPRHGIVGAAWASTASYFSSSLVALFFYCRLSGNRWTVVVFPQRGDWALYWKTARLLGQWAWAKVRCLCSRGGS